MGRRGRTDPLSQRFLVVKLADLGDALTATPALRALRDTFPSARIDTLVTPVGAAALSGLESVDRAIVFDKAMFDRPSASIGPIVRALRLGLGLRREKYDRVFLFHHLFTGAGRLKYRALLAAIGAPWRGGLAENQPGFLTHVARDRGYGVKHEADYWLEVVALAGAISASPRFEFAIDEGARNRARALLGASGRRATYRVALYPGTGPYSPARRWPEGRFAEVGRRLVAELDPAGPLGALEIVILGGDAERDLANRLVNRIGSSARSLAGQTSLKELGAVLEECDLMIANDGGVMHLAVAVGTPVVAIFGPSNPVSWGPYGAVAWRGPATPPTQSLVLWKDLPCAPCLYRGFVPGTPRGCRSRDCLTLTSADEVTGAARHLLSGRRRSTQ